METRPLTVLCITGWCRNGSTIIGNILNEIPGFFHAGELHFLWKNAAGLGANNRCGCGEALADCPLWSEILWLTARGAEPAAHADEVIRRQRACVRTRHTWRVLRHGPRGQGLDGQGLDGQGLDGRDIGEHAALMTRTYRAIADRTGARVIVDTTKIPGEAALLPLLDGLDPYFVHLVRDPRAVALSWQQPKQYVYAMSSTRSTAYWHGFNRAAQAITSHYPERSIFLRYEDFTADPAGTVSALLRLCGADPAANPVRGRTIELRVNHTVTGNPDRFRTGATLIRAAADAWPGLPVPARLAAVTLSWPLLRRYGYRYAGTLRTRPRPGSQLPAGQLPAGQLPAGPRHDKEVTGGSGA
jgi:hypothetical protein